VNTWLNEPRPLSAGFVTEHLVAPARAFDAIVFFERLTPARSIGVAH